MRVLAAGIGVVSHGSGTDASGGQDAVIFMGSAPPPSRRLLSFILVSFSFGTVSLFHRFLFCWRARRFR